MLKITKIHEKPEMHEEKVELPEIKEEVKEHEGDAFPVLPPSETFTPYADKGEDRDPIPYSSVVSLGSKFKRPSLETQIPSFKASKIQRLNDEEFGEFDDYEDDIKDAIINEPVKPKGKRVLQTLFVDLDQFSIAEANLAILDEQIKGVEEDLKDSISRRF